MVRIGIISGSGLYGIPGLKINGKKKISTPFGSPSDSYTRGTIGTSEVLFLPRHSSRHNLPPHMINYRANIWGFKKLGVKRIISVSAVGGIRKDLNPGDIVVLDQIIDMTRARKSTFYDGKTGVIHVDLTHPFCPEMRRILVKAGKIAGIPLVGRGTYAAVDGPRLETAAEIRAFGILGSDVVGMTAMPEASLARELEICYAGLSVVANFAAGIKKDKLTTAEVMETMRDTTSKISVLLREILLLMPRERTCPCKETLKDAKI